jgi:molybdenum cofactor guanylyltransferase
MKGLILCGGKSSRMQQDQSLIAYHGMPQWQYLYTLLQRFVPEVYISGRDFGVPVIYDCVPGGGPSVGLLSAHAAFPSSAWLVLACDLPLISAQSIGLLVDSRDASLDATAFISSFNGYPEPLIAIWEPSGLSLLAHNFAGGYNCPRKAMMKGTVKLLENPFVEEQFNANTQEEMQEAKKKIS